MHIGYARVSTTDQHTENQIEKLRQAGCKKIYEEKASGGRWDRPQLQKCLDHLRDDDVLVVWKLDRLSRSLSDLLRILERVDKAGASFKSLTESLDTTGACGKLMMHMLGAFNEFERSIIRERTRLGLERARANGRIGGGRYKLTPQQQQQAIAWIRSEEKTQAQVAEFFNVDPSTISRMMNEVRRREQKKAGLV
jgi:DNA invertase Pin-like site-specific DNA recombinase